MGRDGRQDVAGRLKVDTQPGGAIVPPFEVFDAASKGVLDVGMTPFGYIQGRHPATIPMSHGPLFGMDGSTTTAGTTTAAA